MIKSAAELLFHPSGLLKPMTGVAKNWSVENSLTCKRELVKIYRELKYNRKNYFSSKFTEKGLKMGVRRFEFRQLFELSPNTSLFRRLLSLTSLDRVELHSHFIVITILSLNF